MARTFPGNWVETHFDDQQAAIEISIFNADRALVRRVEIARDALGNPLEVTQYVGDVFPVRACGSGSCSAEGIEELTEEQKAQRAREIAQLFLAQKNSKQRR